jgi:DNA-binding transcriptional ArsR family regulator
MDGHRLHKQVAPAADEVPERVFAAVARYFGLLAAPARLKILRAVCQSEHSVGEVVAATGLAQTGVSRHLALLHQAGVVTRRKAGNMTFYRTSDPAFIDICRLMCTQVAARIEAGRPLREELLDFAAAHPATDTHAAAGGGARRARPRQSRSPL